MAHPLSPHISLTIEGPVARLRLNRPDKRNAMDQAMWESLPRLVEQAVATPGVRLILLGSATPGIFCAGADIGEFARETASPEWRARNQAAIRATQLALARAPLPVIALVDGDSVGGGCGLALAADIRIASPRARFGITPAKLGLVYPLHDTRLLVDLVGPGQAKRLLYTGRLISAEEAQRIGLVEELAENVESAAEALAAEMIAVSPFTQKATRATVQRILEGTADDDAASTALFDQAFTGPDFAEGVSAFLARRKPDFAR
ncbi:enoyl-CoA hydratase/isomerase family protein [Sandaracinobacter neustonicus]|uniref:enoyl-CoA hydratase/isomerase family protein n=1 Tax=Sandaracinobacter neustonicus TaxID=1715348 RepID=UPI001F2AECB7|nr:enoyl-CoA hydratase/isomerase family protein [Sandaracinobacter neustonicus]